MNNVGTYAIHCQVLITDGNTMCERWGGLGRALAPVYLSGVNYRW